MPRKKKAIEKEPDNLELAMPSPDDMDDAQFLELMNILLEVKELETPICLMVNRITKSMLTAREKKKVDAEMIKIVKEFHEKILDVNDMSPVAVIDALTYIMLSLHVYILETSEEYRKYTDKLRDTVLKGVYIGEDNFDDPSIR